MSAFRDILAALGLERLLDRVRSRRLIVDRAPVADPAPAPAAVVHELLAWSQASFVTTAHGSIGYSMEQRGEIYGRPFLVKFPPWTDQPAGHSWGLAVWTADRSGTGQPEIRAVCRTCSEVNGWAVSAAGCVVEVGGRP